MCFRAEIALTDGRLMAMGQELNTTAETERALRHTLDNMEKELRDLNTTVTDKQKLLELFGSGFAGNLLPSEAQMKTLNMSHEASLL